MVLGEMMARPDRAAGGPTRFSPGLGARLLLAFVGIAFFSVLAAAAGILAFRIVGERLEEIDSTLTPTLAALELSRSAERLIAAAPTLLATTDKSERDVVRAELEADQAILEDGLKQLGAGESFPQRQEVQMIATRFVDEFESLGEVVEARAALAERLETLRTELFATNEEIRRVLGPWTQVLEDEIRRWPSRVDEGEVAAGPRLTSLLEAQDAVRATQERVSGIVGTLAEAATAESENRLTILNFQVGMALTGLEGVATGLDPRLQVELTESFASLRSFTEGANAIAEVRAEEIRILMRAQAQLESARALSEEFRAFMDSLTADARSGAEIAVGDALAVQEQSTRFLMALVVLSFLTAALIVWLYVGRNIVARLGTLTARVTAIAGGDFATPVPVQGADEIGRVGEVVETLRRNTLERNQLEISGRYKTQLLASASHDLRQPLHALNLFVARLRSVDDETDKKRLVDNIESAAKVMTEMFDSLLDMAKLETGALKPHIDSVPIQRLLDQIEATFGARARAKGLRFTVIKNGAWIISDFVLLERMVFNLVSNAVRYTAEGGVVVGLRCRGDQIRIDVCDTGPGIASDKTSLVFGEFAQIAPAPPEGLGLGLAIVQGLGALLAHPIELKSVVGRGSRFSVLVPLGSPKPATAGRTQEPDGAPLNRKLVLVIDDDPLAAEATGEILRSWNHDVACAVSTETALAAVANGEPPPDLIIADYRLGRNETGIDVIRSLRDALGKPVPAFLISGDTGAERTVWAEKEGLHFLSKPVSPMRLRATVEQLLRTGT